MPIGGMTLVPLYDEIQRVKSDRKTLTDEESTKLTNIRNHITSNKYCGYLIDRGLLSSCEDPPEPKDNIPEKIIEYNDANYVYPINSDPY